LLPGVLHFPNFALPSLEELRYKSNIGKFGERLMIRVSSATLAVTFAASALAQSPGTVIPVPGSAQPMGVQPGGVPVARPAVDPKLAAHLDAWEKRMKEIGNVVCDAEKVQTDNVLKRQLAKQVAKIYCLKPNYAFMRLDRAPDQPADPNDFLTYICDGKAIYQYSGRQKEMAEFKLNAAGGIQGNLLLEFISGSMSAKDATNRFNISILKEDANYLYLDIKPTLVSDREDFETMTLVFYSPAIKPELQHLRYLPAMVKMTKNQNKEDEVWTFKIPQINVKGLTPDTFKKQPLPAGWRIAPMAGTATPTSVTPKVARPQGP
jgi:TIGR03009 family protein